MRVLDQLAEKRRWQAVDIAARFANDVTCHKFGRVFKHMDEPVQFAQDIVGDVFRSARFAVKIDRDLGVAKAQFADERTQVLDGTGHILGRVNVELLVVDRQDERAGPTLLLRKRAQVAIAGDTDDFHALGFDCRGQRANTEPRGVLGTVVFINDENRKTKFHANGPANNLNMDEIERVVGPISQLG